MKSKSIVVTTLIACGMATAFAEMESRLEPVLSLEDLVSMCPLIVVGSIADVGSREKLERNERGLVWDGTLQVSKVLKGEVGKSILIHWNGEEVATYKVGTKMIWLLIKSSPNSPWVASRIGSVRPLNERPKIQGILRHANKKKTP